MFLLSRAWLTSCNVADSSGHNLLSVSRSAGQPTQVGLEAGDLGVLGDESRVQSRQLGGQLLHFLGQCAHHRLQGVTVIRPPTSISSRASVHVTKKKQEAADDGQVPVVRCGHDR